MDDTAHPLLPAGVPLLDGGGGALRIGGVDSTDGLLVAGGDTWVAGLLRGLDGRRAHRAVVADAAAAGLDRQAVERLLEQLRGAGLLLDLDPADLLAADAGPAAAARTAVELAAALGPGGRGSGWRARRAAAVEVTGAGRVGAPLAAILAASGIGRVSLRDPEVAGAADAVVGGLSAADEGRPRALAAADAVRRASPSADLRPLPDGARADLVVLTGAWSASDPVAAAAHHRGTAHLIAAVRGETGMVGPLVVPGRTSCLRCADLHRRDADPHWPLLAAQLTRREPPATGATVTCLMTAVTAAVQVLAFLDGGGAPVTLGATVELRPPELQPRIRRWSPHPECGCTAPPGEREARQATMGSATAAAAHRGGTRREPTRRTV